MKRNLILFSIFVGLLTATYFIHERGEHISQKEYLERHQLFQPSLLGELVSFSNAATTIIKNDEGVYISEAMGLPVDSRKLDSALEILGPIQARRFLEKEELSELNFEVAFPHPHYKLRFIFERGFVEYLIGEKLKFGQDFYMKMRWVEGDQEEEVKYVIAHDTSLDEGIYSQETYHLSDRKYMRLLSLLFLDDDFFLRTLLMPDLNPEQIVSFELENRHNRRFSFTFDSLKMVPAVLEGVELDLRRVREYRELLVQLNGERVLASFDEKQLGASIAKMKIVLDGQSDIMINVYENYAGSAHQVATSSRAKGLFFLTAPSAAQFALSAQSFWQRRPEIDWEGEIVLSFPNDGPEITAPTTEAWVSVKQFFSHPARMISRLDKKLATQVLSWKISGTEYFVHVNDQNILLVDTRRQLIYHYDYHAPFPFSLKREDY